LFERIAHYPSLKAVCEGWETVRAELDALDQKAFLDWPEKSIYTGDWSVFPFYRFGEKMESTCATCPRTAALIEDIPGMVTAGFSRLSPGSHIQPHAGYTNQVLRFHLGLSSGTDCGLRVGDKTRGWHPGSAFVFDDTQEHEAWNRGDGDRVVLLLDFKRTTETDITFPNHLRGVGENL
jgi:aspartyl/asparaginyl beta-hydroxylase (cupin superfamily)